MTRDDIIRMAREAEIPFNKWGLIGCEACEQDIDDALICFAALVERRAVAAEREACAQVCENLEWWRTPREVAAAIRARGER